MLDLMKMFCGVLADGGVTAADMAALSTEAKMNPGLPYLQALLASPRVWADVVDCVEVTA